MMLTLPDALMMRPTSVTPASHRHSSPVDHATFPANFHLHFHKQQEDPKPKEVHQPGFATNSGKEKH